MCRSHGRHGTALESLTRPADEAADEDFDHSREIFAGIVARYYGDSDFRARLDADPTRVLREEGLEIPDGVAVKLRSTPTNC